QAEDGIRDFHVTGVQTCALPIFLAAEPPERPLLERPQQLDLDVRLHFRDLIQEERAAVRELEAARLFVDRAGERALFVAEELVQIGRASCRERVWISGGGG